MCSTYEESLVALGLSKNDIGTHSFRKGVASFFPEKGWRLDRRPYRFICGQDEVWVPFRSGTFSKVNVEISYAEEPQQVFH